MMLGQDCYPERLGKLFIVHSPYIFMTAWKMVYPFIDSNTKKKVTRQQKDHFLPIETLSFGQIIKITNNDLTFLLLQLKSLTDNVCGEQKAQVHIAK